MYGPQQKAVAITLPILALAITHTLEHPVIGPQLKGKWITPDIFVKAITARNVLSVGMVLTPRTLNMLIPKIPRFGDIQRYNGANHSGLFKLVYSKKTYYFIVKESGQQADYPVLDRESFKVFAKAVDDGAIEINFPARISSRQNTTIPLTTSRGGLPATAVASAAASSDNRNRSTIEPPQRTKRQKILAETYWDSDEARKLFEPRQGDSSCLETLERRVHVLRAVQNSADGWRHAVIGRDPDDICTEHDKVVLRQKSLMLCLAYQLAIKYMNKKSWLSCCETACKTLNPLGISQTKRGDNIQLYNRLFRKMEGFAHPNMDVRAGKTQALPPMLRSYQNIREGIQRYAVANITGLTVDQVHTYTEAFLLPEAHRIWVTERIEEEDSQQDLSFDAFKKQHRLSSFSPQTTLRWMRRLGMKYDLNRKSYYVDGHERADVVTARTAFCERYLLQYEPRCFRWVHLSKEECDSLPLLDITLGTSFISSDSTEKWEFHEDYLDFLFKDSDDNQPFETRMSIRAPANSTRIEIIGQDECVFSQFLVGDKNWVRSKGERALLPKSEGDGYMISAFQSRLFGFGRPMTSEELKLVNDAREGQDYWDEEAAKEVHKTPTPKKGKLTESPFVRSILIGANNDGYWNSAHMAIQLEDIVDCLKVLYVDIEFIFIFDHSQGHSRKRTNGLDAAAMNVKFGGAQPRMRPSLIASREGHLGTNDPLLKVNDTQLMSWADSEGPEGCICTAATKRSCLACGGPFEMSPDELQSRMNPTQTNQMKERDKTRAELVKDIEEKGVTLQRKHTLVDLQDIASKNNVVLRKTVAKIIPGWLGQPKGLLQVARERGMVELDNVRLYTKSGKKQQDGTKDESKSLAKIVGSCTDFKNELTHIQVLAEALGIKVDFTPKFHAEIAGEGVEYSWAHSKGSYRRKPLQRKKSRASFRDLVKECIGRENLTTRRVRRFSARSRAYICTYHYLSGRQQGEGGNNAMGPLLLDDIEKLMKEFKTHRSAFDFDRGRFLGDCGGNSGDA